MSLGRVLVIEGDDDVATPLVRALTDEGFTVERRAEARAGFQCALEVTPDCIVCASELPDLDGAWLVRRVRTEAGRVAKTPIILIGESRDRAVRQQALAVGVDAYVTRPAAIDEIATHVTALVGMSRRLVGDNGPPSSTSLGAAIRGDLAQFPLASVLMMFEMERRSGLLDIVAASGKRAKLLLVSGLFSATEIDGQDRPALEVLREVLSWRAGRFAFSPREHVGTIEPRGSVGALVLEAMRLEDEKNSAEPPPVAPASAIPVSLEPSVIEAAETDPMLAFDDTPPPMRSPAAPPPVAPRPPPLPPRPSSSTLRAAPNVDAPPPRKPTSDV